MVNEIFLKLLGVLEKIRDFIVNWGLKTLVAIIVLIIIHNVIKIGEISSRYTGEYKNLTPVYEKENKFMNYYTVGEGEKTIVILPEFGSQSPIIQYKALVNGLKDKYKVVVIEYFGYGFSMSMKNHERTNDNIVDEVKKVLEYREIYGPYVFIAADTSNIYAMRFQEKYPELVQGIISIDGVYPAEVNDEFLLSNIRNRVSNININSIFELTGFERIVSYVSPKVFYIDKMKKMTDVYTKEDISIYRNRIGSSYLSRTMVREANKLEENMYNMKDYKWKENIPVLEIVSSEKKDIYENYKNSNKSNINLIDLANEVITNNTIQRIEAIDGNQQMLQLSNTGWLLQAVRNFLSDF